MEIDMFIKREDMTPEDLVLWEQLIRVVQLAIEQASVRRNNTFIRDLRTLNKQLCNTGIGAGQAYLLERDFPSFMDDMREQYAAAMNKFFGVIESSDPYDLKHVRTSDWHPLGALHLIPYSDANSWDKITQQLPHVSTNYDMDIAFIRDAKSLIEGKPCVKTKIGRYVERQLNAYVSVDLIRKEHIKLNASFIDKLRFIENDDIDGWQDAYRSPVIKSCMNSNEYGVTNHETYRCYATSAFGLPSNGLRLAIIENGNQVICRSIVHEPSKTFCKVYVDKNNIITIEEFEEALKHNGYEKSSKVPEGMFLWTADEGHGYIHPYADWDEYAVSINSMNGMSVIVFSDGGNLDIKCTEGLFSN